MARLNNARRIDGVLLLDKPLGPSSNTILQHIKKLFSAQRAGHTGTLDPRATGLLPICLGEATKFGSQLLESDKAYLASLRLGVRTETGDAEGAVVESRPVNVDQLAVNTALTAFQGTIEQVPPMYSALKKDGQPLYKLARLGVSVERAPRRITISRLEAKSLETDMLKIYVRCSKGTYIRTLAEDIGEYLGCGAHLASLRRIEIGSLNVSEAISLEQLEALKQAARFELLLPVERLVAELPKIELGEIATRRFQQGQENVISPGNALATTGQARVYAASGYFLGLGILTAEGRLRPHRLLATAHE